MNAIQPKLFSDLPLGTEFIINGIIHIKDSKHSGEALWGHLLQTTKRTIISEELQTVGVFIDIPELETPQSPDFRIGQTVFWNVEGALHEELTCLLCWGNKKLAERCTCPACKGSGRQHFYCTGKRVATGDIFGIITEETKAEIVRSVKIYADNAYIHVVPVSDLYSTKNDAQLAAAVYNKTAMNKAKGE
jgi:hypothetical protein